MLAAVEFQFEKEEKILGEDDFDYWDHKFLSPGPQEYVFVNTFSSQKLRLAKAPKPENPYVFALKRLSGIFPEDQPKQLGCSLISDVCNRIFATQGVD